MIARVGQVLALSVPEQVMAVWEELSRLGLDDHHIAAMVHTRTTCPQWSLAPPMPYPPNSCGSAMPVQVVESAAHACC